MRRVATALTLTVITVCTPQLAAAQAPAGWGPVSVDLTDLPYPHPVQTFPLVVYGQNVNMNYMDVKPSTPNGRTVVLLHGFNFSGEAWANTIDALVREGFRVIVPDQVGFGRSSKPYIPYTFNDMALNTRKLLERLGVERAAIVGHSMGGMLASRFAMLYPTITSHVVMVNQIGLSDARPGRAPRYLDAAYQNAPPARTYEQIRQGITRYFVEWKPEYEKYVRMHWGWTLSPDWPRFSRVRAALQQMLSAETVVYDWQHIKSKALVIGGARDTPTYAAQAKRVAESIPGAQLELIENVGHCPHLEAPAIFQAKLIEFLKHPT